MAEKRTFRQWAERFNDDSEKLTLEEFSARVLAHACDNTALTTRKLDTLLSRVKDLCSYLIVTTGGEFNRSNDPRYVIARALLEAVETGEIKTIEAAEQELARLTG